MGTDQMQMLLERLDRIEAIVSELLRQRTVKDFYEIEEFAKLVGREPFTAREWARLGRINAEKKNSGRVRMPVGWSAMKNCFGISGMDCCPLFGLLESLAYQR